MAKYRVVNTRFWDDAYVAELNPTEKLVFLYLLTNPLTTIGGVYELALKRAAFDVGLPIKDLKPVFEKLETDGKIVRQDGWICLVNFIKHQSLNPKVRRGIEIEHEKAPVELVARLQLPAEFQAESYGKRFHADKRGRSEPAGLFAGNVIKKQGSELDKALQALVKKKRM